MGARNVLPVNAPVVPGDGQGRNYTGHYWEWEAWSQMGMGRWDVHKFLDYSNDFQNSLHYDKISLVV